MYWGLDSTGWDHCAKFAVLLKTLFSMKFCFLFCIFSSIQQIEFIQSAIQTKYPKLHLVIRKEEGRKSTELNVRLLDLSLFWILKVSILSFNDFKIML